MSDTDRLREKTVQIVALTQKIDALQAQLTGAQKRAAQLTAEVQSLTQAIAERDAEIKRLKVELERANACTDALGKEIRAARMTQVQTQSPAKKQSEEEIERLKRELEQVNKSAQIAQQNVKTLSEAALAVINNQEGAIERLRDTLLRVGDPKYRVFSLVLQKRRLKTEEIAAIIYIDVQSTMEILEDLQSAGEVEIREGDIVIPGKKYREIDVPVEKWKSAAPAQVFVDLEQLVARAEEHETVAKIIGAAVEVLEQKIPRAGALVFQMRKTANGWRTTQGNIDELRYTIREWKARALALG